MTAATTHSPHALTVLGPVAVEELGITLVHEALLSVLPGAQYAPDITIDRAEVFEILAERLNAFHAAGGRTIVDSTGMFHGRDLPLLEALSRSTGVHIIASTGMGPEEMLGGYFLTPQTNPPTPWPADKFADLFALEVSEGMVVPRVERRAAAGLVTTAAAREGMTATEQSLFRGAARAALQTGVPVSLRFGADVLHDLDVALGEGLAAERVLMGSMDRREAAQHAAAVAERGAFVGIDHVGSSDEDHLSDEERADLLLALREAGQLDRVLLSSNAIGVAKGLPGNDVAWTHVLTDFADLLRSRGLADAEIQQLLVANPAALLAVATPTTPTTANTADTTESKR